jgi:hypothetical protein
MLALNEADLRALVMLVVDATRPFSGSATMPSAPVGSACCLVATCRSRPSCLTSSHHAAQGVVHRAVIQECLCDASVEDDDV